MGFGLSLQRLTLTGATFGFVLLSVVAIVLVAKVLAKKRTQQDVQYKDQLSRLTQVFEKYRQANGTYPLSAAYSPEHYTGIHMDKEWRDYQFPNDQTMKGFDADWPIVDQAKLKTIVYFPKEQGSRFALYAEIETLPKDESRDFNVEDNLPKAWGEFNYRLTSAGFESGGDMRAAAPGVSQTIKPSAMATPLPAAAQSDEASESAAQADSGGLVSENNSSIAPIISSHNSADSNPPQDTNDKVS